MLRILDSVHARARAWPPLSRVAIVIRILLALAFVPTGMVKMLGQRFTQLDAATPVGYFFDAMYQSGIYWNFIGASQVMAGILLLMPVTTTLGALACFPIVLNITVVTWSIGFQGTTYITTLMLLASAFLLCWDWDRLRSIVVVPSDRAPHRVERLHPFERAGYIVGTAAGMVVFHAIRGLMPVRWVGPAVGAGVVAALLVLYGWIQLARHDRR